jgi:hypothetical protein
MIIMRKLLFALILLSSYQSYSQIDLYNMRKWQFGAMYDRTDVTGLYALEDPTTNFVRTDLTDYKVNMNAEIKQFISSKRSVINANIEGILYEFGRLVSLNKTEGHYNEFNTLLDPLTSNDCHNVALPSGSGYINRAAFSNLHIADVTSSGAIGDHFYIGGNCSFRQLGFPTNYTVYKTETPKDQIMICTMSSKLKLLMGLNCGYRTMIGKRAAFFVTAGVNTGLNVKGFNKTDLTTIIQVKYNPFINPTLFIGGKRGLYVGLYWEKMIGKDKLVYPYVGMFPNQPPAGDATFMTKVNATQLQVKIGFYLAGKKEGEDS